MYGPASHKTISRTISRTASHQTISSTWTIFFCFPAPLTIEGCLVLCGAPTGSQFFWLKGAIFQSGCPHRCIAPETSWPKLKVLPDCIDCNSRQQNLQQPLSKLQYIVRSSVLIDSMCPTTFPCRTSPFVKFACGTSMHPCQFADFAMPSVYFNLGADRGTAQKILLRQLKATCGLTLPH